MFSSQALQHDVSFKSSRRVWSKKRKERILLDLVALMNSTPDNIDAAPLTECIDDFAAEDESRE